jgi:hypothetical protein
LVSNFSGVCLG